MPTKSFGDRATALPTNINATEYIALLWQLLPVLGVGGSGVRGGSVLPPEQAKDVSRVIAMVLEVYYQLWKERHVESELEALHRKIIE